jgi:tetratricopeptide (TPR) repeat protein
LLIALALLLARRRPLLSFGILWFYVSLSVESSIIPLDAMVEHRLYTPMLGFAVAVTDLFRWFSGKRVALVLLCIVIAGYAFATVKRNLLWSDPIAFALDGRDKAPHNQRNHLTLATAYADAGRWGDAENALRKAIPVRPYHYVPYDNLGVALAQQGKYNEARTWFSLASLLSPDYPNSVYNYGYVSLRLGDTAAATRSLERLRELQSPLATQLGAQFMGK